MRISVTKAIDLRFQIVSVHPDTPADMADDVVDGVVSWIGSGSQRLYAATGGLAYVADVKILIPESWTEVEGAVTSTDVAFEVRRMLGGGRDFPDQTI